MSDNPSETAEVIRIPVGSSASFRAALRALDACIDRQRGVALELDRVLLLDHGAPPDETAKEVVKRIRALQVIIDQLVKTSNGLINKVANDHRAPV